MPSSLPNGLIFAVSFVCGSIESISWERALGNKGEMQASDRTTPYSAW